MSESSGGAVDVLYIDVKFRSDEAEKSLRELEQAAGEAGGKAGAATGDSLAEGLKAAEGKLGAAGKALGTQAADGVAEGVKSGTGKVGSAADELAQGVKAADGKMQSAGKALGDQAADGVAGGVKAGGSKVESATDGLAQGVKAADGKMQAAGKALGDQAADGVAGGVKAGGSKVESATDGLAQGVKAADGKMQAAGKELGTQVTDGMADGVKSGTGKVEAAADDATKGVKGKLGAGLGNLGGLLDSAGISTGIADIGSSLMAAAGPAGLLAAGLTAVAAVGPFIADSINVYADFEKQLNALKAVSGATASELGNLKDQAYQLGQSTTYSATEVVNVQTELSKAGVSIKDILGGATEGTLLLAAATGSELPDALDVSTKAMNVFNLSGKDVGHIADVISNGANQSALDVGTFSTALAAVGKVAPQAGLNLEETTGVLSLFADNALEGSDAGTSLKTMLLALLAPSDKAAGQLAEMGVNVYEAHNKLDQMGVSIKDSEGNLRPFQAIISDLNGKFSQMSEQQRNAAMQTIFGSDAIRAASILYSEGSGKLFEYTQKMYESGTAADNAKTRQEGLRGAQEQLGGAMETLKLHVGEFFTPAMTAIVTAATAAVTALSDLFGWMVKVANGGTQAQVAEQTVASLKAKLASVRQDIKALELMMKPENYVGPAQAAYQAETLPKLRLQEAQLQQQISAAKAKATELKDAENPQPTAQPAVNGSSLYGRVGISKFTVTQGFGAHPENPAYKKFGGHEGVDFGTPVGTPIAAPFSGRIFEKTDKMWGRYLELQDEKGQQLIFAHLSAYDSAITAKIKAGGGSAIISAGERLGFTGGQPGADGAGNSTGPHLHVSAKNSAGKFVDPSTLDYAGVAKPPSSSGAGTASTGPDWDTLIAKARQLQKALADAAPGSKAWHDATVAVKGFTKQGDDAALAMQAAQAESRKAAKEGTANSQDWDTLIAKARQLQKTLSEAAPGSNAWHDATLAAQKFTKTGSDAALAMQVAQTESRKAAKEGTANSQGWDTLIAKARQLQKTLSEATPGSTAWHDATLAVQKFAKTGSDAALAMQVAQTEERKAAQKHKETSEEREQRVYREKLAQDALAKSLHGATDARLAELKIQGVNGQSLEKWEAVRAEIARREQERTAQGKRDAAERKRQHDEAARNADAAAKQADQLAAKSAGTATEAARLRVQSIAQARDTAVQTAGKDMAAVLAVQQAYAPKFVAAANQEAAATLAARKLANDQWKEGQEDAARKATKNQTELNASLSKIRTQWQAENRNADTAYHASLTKNANESATTVAQANERAAAAQKKHQDDVARSAETAARQADQLAAKSAGGAVDAARIRAQSLATSRDDAVRAAGQNMEAVLAVQRAYAPKVQAAADQEAGATLKARQLANDQNRDAQEEAARKTITGQAQLKARLAEIESSWRTENTNAYGAYYGALKRASSDAATAVGQAAQRAAADQKKHQDEVARNADAAAKQADQLASKAATSATEAARIRSQSLTASRDQAVQVAGQNLEAVLAVQRAYAPKVQAAAEQEAGATLKARQLANDQNRDAQEEAAHESITDQAQLKARLSEIESGWRTENTNAYGAYYLALGTASRAAATVVEQAGQRVADAAAKGAEAVDAARYKLSASLLAYSYGTGDTGLIRSLSGLTGLSVQAVRDDVQGVLDSLRQSAPQLASMIEGAYGEALKHRRDKLAADKDLAAQEVALYEKTRTDLIQTVSARTDDGLLRLYDQARATQDRALLDAVMSEMTKRADALQGRINEGYAQESVSRIAAIKAEFDAEHQAADDASITTEYLGGLLDRLTGQGRSPEDSGFIQWLDELIAKGSQAAQIAQTFKESLTSFLTEQRGLAARLSQENIDRIRAETQAADDAAADYGTTLGSLTDILNHAVGQDIDPRQSGFVNLLDEIIQKGGEAADAAKFVKTNLDALLDDAGATDLGTILFRGQKALKDAQDRNAAPVPDGITLEQSTANSVTGQVLSDVFSGAPVDQLGAAIDASFSDAFNRMGADGREEFWGRFGDLTASKEYQDALRELGSAQLYQLIQRIGKAPEWADLKVVLEERFNQVSTFPPVEANVLEAALQGIIDKASSAEVALKAGIIDPEAYTGKLSPLIDELGALAENLERVGNASAADSVRKLLAGLASTTEGIIDPNKLATATALAQEVYQHSLKTNAATLEADRETYQQRLQAEIDFWKTKVESLKSGGGAEYLAAVKTLDALIGTSGDLSLSATVKVLGVDTGIKELDLYKNAVQGVADVITQSVSDLVSGTGNAVDGILVNMAKMALGIVKQVAVAIAAYEAQAIALAIISGASFNFVQAGLALAAAATVAGIASGLEARLTPGKATGKAQDLPTGVEKTDTSNNVISYPNSQVTVMAAPSWVADVGKHIDRFGGYIERLVTEGVYIRTDRGTTAASANSLAWELGSA